MKLGIRSKLFGISLLLILVVGMISGTWLESELRTWLSQRIEQELVEKAHVARVAIDALPDSEALAAVDTLAKALGAAMNARVTVIAGDGVVLGDSEASFKALRRMQNHLGHAEVTQALRSGVGISHRYSDTVGTQMVYVAIPYGKGDVLGVVRASVPLTDVDELIEKLRFMLLVAAFLGLAVAVSMSATASHFMTRALRRLSQNARKLLKSPDGRLVVSSRDELGLLAGSFNEIADELELTVETLASERERFEVILESLSSAVIALDDKNRITLANHSALVLLELNESPVGKSLIEVVRSPGLSELAQNVQAAAATGEFSLRHKKQIVGKGAPLSHTGGVVLLLEDVTEIRALESVRKDFVANVSHELRTPVSVIRATTETLQGGAMSAHPEQTERFLDAIIRNADRLNNLVSDLLDLSRIEAGRLNLNMQPLVIADVTQRALSEVRPLAEKKQLELIHEVDDSMVVYADADALEQVVLNLLGNAVNYTPDGGSIRVRARTDGADVTIEIQDNGIGIPKEHRARVFERFYRVDTGRSREVGGTGLGLSIVKHLINSMHGDVGVSPAEPKGSTFWFTLRCHAG